MGRRRGASSFESTSPPTHALPCQDDLFDTLPTSFQDALHHASTSAAARHPSPGPSSTPTTGERIVTHLAEFRETVVNALQTYADTFDRLDAAKYIERLERQKNALEVGAEAKTKRIAQLTAECDALKDKLARCVVFLS